MTSIFQTASRGGPPAAVLAAWTAVWCVLFGSGCGLQTGYAPREVPVHRGTAGGPRPDCVDSLTVVSWNIQYGEDLGQALAELRANPRLAAADILLLQEMDPAGSALLADSLGLHYVHGSASVHPHHGRLFGNAVLSRWPIVGDHVLILPHETLLTGHRRIAVAADIDLGGGRTLRAVSIHTATMIMDQDQREEQARAAADSLGGLGGLTVIGGDFNTVSDYESRQLGQDLRRLGLSAVRLPAGPTIGNRLVKLPGLTPVLDHLFCRGFAVGETGIGRETLASDHFPIWAVLRPENQQ